VANEDLVRSFGSDVADPVAEVTDDKSWLKAERKRLQIVNAPKKSVRAQFIKLADKISNLRAILSSRCLIETSSENGNILSGRDRSSMD
jgi:(p)ppGpp synthase/HD superfamily hydrolase